MGRQLHVGNEGKIFSIRGNSITAFSNDYDASKQVFQRPYIGLTAASVVNTIHKDGWIDHNRYISNQGSFGHGTDNPYDVVQTAPAPYGNALALPFLNTTGQAAESIKNYMDMGFVHPLIGLPDNVQLANTAGLAPIPSWKLLDINVGSAALAIEQYLGKDRYGIARDYLKDNSAKRAYEALLASWEHSVTSGSAREETVQVAETSDPVQTEILCSPNPSYDGEFLLSFSIAEAGQYQGMLVDLNGRVMARPEWTFDKPGRYIIQFHDLAEARAHGVFLLAIRGPKTHKLVKLIVR
ncbi:MAG: hypothetical protein HC859_12295 [Bacteroidia bacterium]|nr:hypothetical protein [Bacteroidia bacterium]